MTINQLTKLLTDQNQAEFTTNELYSIACLINGFNLTIDEAVFHRRAATPYPLHTKGDLQARYPWIPISRILQDKVTGCCYYINPHHLPKEVR